MKEHPFRPYVFCPKCHRLAERGGMCRYCAVMEIQRMEIDMETGKKFYFSKTLWVMGLGFAALLAQEIAGEEIVSPAIQGSLLALVGFALRMVTGEKLEW